ncbi:MAG: tRNA (adenosine(37)-N6)-dimethylallyltransferase MiaA [Tannerellaceae bacterium]|nr:tRNA (adenosine(37)-N6)-dimethylallyltransferase MiaA [Tannerellaceae bacterium]
MRNTLIILCGPTGVGKTELSLRIAELSGAPIISADSRQLYKEIALGTAAPTPLQMQRIRHYMVGILELTDYYSAYSFETDVLALLDTLYLNTPLVLLTGGSMMYIDAVCKGIDDIPTVTPEIRHAVYRQYEREGLLPLLEELKAIDPVHYEKIDRQNYKRVIHAVEICRTSARPYSAFCTNSRKERPFRILKIGLTRDRKELCERIDRRVEQMMDEGLLEEARRVYPFKHLNALNTVGYKELFQYIDGNWTLEFAVEKIKRNTRVYARKQMTWFKRDKEIAWFHPENEDTIRQYIHNSLDI